MWSYTHCTHEGVEYTDSEGGSTGKRLCQVQLCVRVVVIILVQELNIGVVHWERKVHSSQRHVPLGQRASNSQKHTKTPENARNYIHADFLLIK